MDSSNPPLRPARLNVDLVRERMAEHGLSASDIARHCEVSRTSVSDWLAGGYLPRPSKMLRMAVLLKLNYREMLGLPEAPVEVVQVLVGKTGRIAQDLKDRFEDCGHCLLSLTGLFEPVSLFTRPVVVEPVLTPEHFRAVVAETRRLLSKATEEGLHASDFIRLLRRLDVQVSPSLYGNDAKAHWTSVTHLPRHGNRLVVHVPILASPEVLLRGLAEAYGVCVSLHRLAPDSSREYARGLARQLLVADSRVDLPQALAPRSSTEFVALSREAGLGAVMDAVEKFQVADGGRNHSFVSRALHVGLLDAYELSADLYPGVRERMRQAAAQQEAEAAARNAQE